MKAEELTSDLADHIIVEAVRKNDLPASQLPKVMDSWETPEHEEFQLRTAWSLYNAFTEVQKARSPRIQMESGLLLIQVVRDLL